MFIKFSWVLTICSIPIKAQLVARSYKVPLNEISFILLFVKFLDAPPKQK